MRKLLCCLLAILLLAGCNARHSECPMGHYAYGEISYAAPQDWDYSNDNDINLHVGDYALLIITRASNADYVRYDNLDSYYAETAHTAISTMSGEISEEGREQIGELDGYMCYCTIVSGGVEMEAVMYMQVCNDTMYGIMAIATAGPVENVELVLLDVLESIVLPTGAATELY